MARRFVDAALLRPRAYALLETDSTARVHMTVIVVAVALAHALGAVLRASAFGWNVTTGFVLGAVGAVAAVRDSVLPD